MKKSTYNRIVALLLAVIVVGGGMLLLRDFGVDEPETQPTEPSAPTQTTEPANLAPDFTVEDGQGNSVKLSDFRGTPVVLNFWASWCGPCKAEMPEFEEAYHTYGDRVQFMMVNLTDGMNDTKRDADAVITESGYTFPVFYDTLAEGGNAFQISSIPVTCFIDADGTIVMQQVGMLSKEALEQGIQAILFE